MIPLYLRAVISKDRLSQECVSQLDYPWPTELLVFGKGPFETRIRLFTDSISRFIAIHPEATILNLGCGFDTSFWKLDNGILKWIEIDFPEVIALRRKIFGPSEARHLLCSGSALDREWTFMIGVHTLVIADGLLPHLSFPDRSKLIANVALSGQLRFIFQTNFQEDIDALRNSGFKLLRTEQIFGASTFVEAEI